MEDAGGKPGPGILEGNLNYVGNFEECQRVTATFEEINFTISSGSENKPGMHDFDARYCRIYWKLPQGVSLQRGGTEKGESVINTNLCLID